MGFLVERTNLEHGVSELPDLVLTNEEIVIGRKVVPKDTPITIVEIWSTTLVENVGRPDEKGNN